MNARTEFLVTLWAAEWFLISVDSFVGLQMTCQYELLITLCRTVSHQYGSFHESLSYEVEFNEFLGTNQTAEWFFISVNSFMALQITCLLCECFVTFWATEWLLISVNFFMCLQRTSLAEFFVTLWAAKWLLFNMDSCMHLQIPFLIKFLVTFWTAEWF